jgi:prevent-host-death family protein
MYKMRGFAVRRIKKRVGKAQAREEFSTLVEAVASGAGAIQITDYGKVAAVLLSEKEYEWLCACAEKNAHPKRNPRGYFILADKHALNFNKDPFDSLIVATTQRLALPLITRDTDIIDSNACRVFWD